MPPINNTLEKILEEFDEKFLDKKEPFSSRHQFNEEVRGMLPAKFRDFITHVYQTAINEAKAASIRSVPEEKWGDDDKEDETYFYDGWSNCRSQTLSNLEDNFKELV